MAYEIKTFRVRLAVAEEQRQEVKAPETAAAILRAIYADLDADQEHVTVLSVNGANKITGYKVIASGQMGSAAPDMKLLFRAVLTLGGTAFILAHNHPSGEARPSLQDKEFTVKAAAELLGFRLLDHIVLGHAGAFYSFKTDGAV
jgi:DNA repair protein RadC